jgi:hypothetical protein
MISEPAFDRLSALLHRPDVSGTRYELVSELGRGGMGVVYLARDTVLDREVALKIVDAASGDESIGAAQAVEKEARILAKLEHPGLVPIHDFGQLPDGRLFYAMKRVRGDRLDRWVAAGRDLTARLGVFPCASAMPSRMPIRTASSSAVSNPRASWLANSARCSCSTGASPPPRGTAISRRPWWGRETTWRRSRCVRMRTSTNEPMCIRSARSWPERRPTPRRWWRLPTKRSADPAARYPSVPALAADVTRFVAGLAVEAHRERLIDRLARGRRYRLPILLVLALPSARAATVAGSRFKDDRPDA